MIIISEDMPGKQTHLLPFMNELYNYEQIPTDFVYTGKMFFAT
jgi:hypothetical protein